MADEKPRYRLAVLDAERTLVSFETVDDIALWVRSATRVPVPMECDLPLMRYVCVDLPNGKFTFAHKRHPAELADENTGGDPIVKTLVEAVLDLCGGGDPTRERKKALRVWLKSVDAKVIANVAE